LKTALVVSVRNEAATIRQTLEALDAQTRPPDEIVIVDGGSTDGTLDALEEWARDLPARTVLSSPGASIGGARNLAIGKSHAEIVAVTDAGCLPERDWLERITAPLVANSADFAKGFYRGDPRNRFERLTDCLNLPDSREVDPGGFMPSSRSVAFTRGIWERVGGYPEWLEVGEDMYFDFRIAEAGARSVFVPDAVVLWRLRPDLRAFMRQYFNYARGDGLAGMYPRRHAVRFGAYASGAGVAAAAGRWPAALALPATLGAAWLLPSYRRAFRRLPLGEALMALPAMPLLAAVMDLAKMAGYLAGRRQRRRLPPAS
jgi:glycosyltransferase involved in cell wall biosynthesis